MGKLSYFHPGQNTAKPIVAKAQSAIVMNDLININKYGKISKYNQRLTVAENHVDVSSGSNALLQTVTMGATDGTVIANTRQFMFDLGTRIFSAWTDSGNVGRYQWLDKYLSPITAPATLDTACHVVDAAFNGTEVTVVTANTSNVLKVFSFNVAGQVGATLNLAATSMSPNQGMCRAKVLATGETAIGWFDVGVSNNYPLKLAKVNPATGLQVGTTVTLTTLARTELAGGSIESLVVQHRYFELDLFASGEVAMIWSESSGPFIKWATYSTTAGAGYTQVGTTQTIQTGVFTSTGYGTVRTAKLGTTRMVYSLTLDVGGTKAYILNNDGTQGTHLSLKAAATASYDRTVCETLSDGKVAIVYYNYAAPTNTLTIINTNGTLLITKAVSLASGLTHNNAYAQSYLHQLIAPFPGKFVLVALHAGSGWYAYGFDNDGVQRTPTLLSGMSSLGASGISNAGVSASKISGENVILISYGYEGSTPTSNQNAASVTADAQLNWGLNLSTWADGNHMGTGSGAVIVDSGVAYVIGSDISGSTQYKYRRFLVEKQSLLGVAQSTAAADAFAKVATVGTYQINQTVVGGAFNQQSATPSGNKGFASGTSVILSGVV
jgi:hypothetical protein